MIGHRKDFTQGNKWNGMVVSETLLRDDLKYVRLSWRIVEAVVRE